MLKRLQIFISGQVQGVGFRPWVHRLAVRAGLTGLVRNNTRGVYIEWQGPPARLDSAVAALRNHDHAPPLASIKSLEIVELAACEHESGFVIAESSDDGSPSSNVTVDTAVCDECLAEMNDSADFRYRYPFINCTNCGPRYSIVKAIPYDRPNTTMAAFEMCPRCAAQYADPADRRFHAQPVACPACGPQIYLTDPAGKLIESGTDATIAAAAKMLARGEILAVKGIGGFHLACDAGNEEAVKLLRTRKHREHKPFAMMAADIPTIARHARVCDAARKILSSPQAPIVLLPRRSNHSIAPSVAPGTNTFGFMLPYAPIHHLLFAEQGIATLVMTSANIADEPLVCDNGEALRKLSAIADAFLMHERDIFRPLDDSIVHIVEDEPVLLRRARGYVPSPIIINNPAPRPILAAGADLKNTFCLARDNQLILSEHIGDLENAETLRHYRRSIPHLAGLFELEPAIIAADKHPGYFSTQNALSLPIPHVDIQHHWAHIASVLAEHNYSGQVIGIAADGTGYGDDGAVWGCECLIASLQSYERFAHLDYFPLAGGDRAAKEALRPLLGLLAARVDIQTLDELLERIEPSRDVRDIILKQIELGINTVQSSSLGRLFDAVAALAGLGGRNNFEAQLPIALEAIADSDIAEAYPFGIIEGEPLRLDVSPLIQGIIGDLKREVPGSTVSAKFHNALAAAFAEICRRARKKSGLDTVALSGGVFCNRLLLERTINLLKQNGFSVLYNKAVPSNDGGVALGQAAMAARRTADGKDPL